LQTPTGTLRARCLIVATNATRPDTAFSLRERGMPIACAMLASEPLDPQAYVDFPGPWTWADDPLLFSGLVDHRNRLTTSVLVGRDARSAETIGTSADRSFERYFPAASLPVWSHCWQGDILATSDGLPRLVQLDEECFAAFGCNGFGIALGTLLGIELAKLARGSEEAPELPLGRAPRSIANRLMPFLLENLLVPLARRAG
jgi:glycine/D-amino acid oxidase-like deaminating enzyme